MAYEIGHMIIPQSQKTFFPDKLGGISRTPLYIEISTASGSERDSINRRIDGRRIDGRRIDGRRIDGRRIDGAALATARRTDIVWASARTPLYSEGCRNKQFSPRRPFYILRSMWRLSFCRQDRCSQREIQWFAA